MDGKRRGHREGDESIISAKVVGEGWRGVRGRAEKEVFSCL